MIVLQATFQLFAVVSELAQHQIPVPVQWGTLGLIVHILFVMVLQATFQLFAVVMENVQHQIIVIVPLGILGHFARFSQLVII